MWDKLDQSVKPDPRKVAEYINTPLWPRFLAYMEDKYQARPEPSYSRCSMLAGWNYKYKKAGLALCTVYPMSGSFSALVSLGPRETEGAEALMPALSAYTQATYAASEPSRGIRWLLLEITSAEILDDLTSLLALRRSPKK